MERTLAAMPRRDRTAPMMLPWTPGTDVAEGTEPFESASAWVATDHLGGILISTGTPWARRVGLQGLPIAVFPAVRTTPPSAV